MAKRWNKSIREQCNKCRHFTGIGNDANRNRITSRNINDIDNKPNGRGTCAAGVNYNDVMKPGVQGIALPCFPIDDSNKAKDGSPLTCAKQSFMSDAELDAEAAEIEAHAKQFIERVTIVRPAILKHANVTERYVGEDEISAGARRAMDGVTVIAKERKDKRGQMPCPICKTGTLGYRVSGYNGHVHARCSTNDCISFME